MFPSIPLRLARDFKWSVPKSGYRLHEVNIEAWARSPQGYELDWDDLGAPVELIGHRHGDKVLVPRDLRGELEERAPFTDPALYQNFARVDESSEAEVLAFADQHGGLSIDAFFYKVRADRFFAGKSAPNSDEAEQFRWDDSSTGSPPGESLSMWRTAIRLMKIGITLWNLSREHRDVDRLAVKRVMRDHQAILEDQYQVGLREQVETIRTRRDALKVAQSIALSELNASDALGGSGFRWNFVEVLPHNRHVLEICPWSLGVGLFLQLATAIAADAKYHECAHCGGVFDAANTRRTRMYCTDSCKTRAYNKRKANAAATPRPKRKRVTA